MKTLYAETIWTTKKCQQLISNEIENSVYEFLRAEFNALGCEVKAINGTSDHVHCLINVNAKRSLDEIVKLVKGVSSHNINQGNLLATKFAWEKSYDGDSVGKKDMKECLEKILNQKTLHLDPSYTIEDEINRMHEREIE